MKKALFMAILALAMVLSACAGQSEPTATTPSAPVVSEPTAPAATAEPTPDATPELSGEPATVLINDLGAVFATFGDGTEWKISGKQGACYLVDYEGVTVLVEDRFIHLASDLPLEPWEGFAKNGAPAYDNVYLSGEALKKLPLNTRLTVLAQLGSVLKAKLADGTVVYVPADTVNDYMTQYHDPGGGAPAPADGGDIVLTSSGVRRGSAKIVLLAVGTPAYPISGTILAEGVEGYISILRRGDSVKVIDKENDRAVLLVDGHRCTVPMVLVRTADEKEFESWDGYARIGATIYPSWRMIGGEAVAMNTPVKVWEDLGDCFYVTREGGFGYMSKSFVGDAPAAWDYGYSGGGNSGGSAGGSAEWTEPTK